MSEWKEYKLGELAEITSAKRIFYSEYVPQGVPFYRSKEVIDKFLKREVQTELFISEEKFTTIKDKFGVPEKDDILLTSVGTLGVPYLVRDKDRFYFKDGNLTWFRNIDKNTIDVQYLFIWLQSIIGKQKLDEITIGSTQSALTIQGLKSVSILLPELKKQTAIASILSSLDDKIDLLHRQNKTLEQMAETIFRQWFVEEAEEGWEDGFLDDEFEFTMGQSPAGETLNEDKNGIVFFQGRTDFGFRFPEPRIYTTSPTRIAKPLDTLVSVRAPVGDMNMAYEECCLGRGVAAFRYKNNKDYYSYTYYKLRSLMTPIKQFEDNGSVFGSIGKEDFKTIENVIPPINLINEFQKKAKPIDDKIILNTTQIRSLTQLRDTLLPKLMSGEVRVKTEKE